MNTEKELSQIDSKINDFGFAYGLGEIFIAVTLWWMWGFKLIMPEQSNLQFLIMLGGIGVLGRVSNFFRKKYVIPRTGYLKRNNFSKRELMKTLYILLLCIILVAPLFIAKFDHGFTALATFTNTYLNIIMGFAFAVYMYLVGKIGPFRNAKYYGLALGFSFAIRQIVPVTFDHIKIFWSILLIISGSIQFYRFMKKYPVQQPDNTQDYETVAK